MSSLPRIATAAAALLFVALLLATHARSYFFLWDDTAVVALAAQLPARELLTGGVAGFYRPLGFLLWKAEFVAFGWNRPWAFAATSILLHATSAFVLLLVLERLAARARAGRPEPRPTSLAPVAGALLFLASPWATEAVFWVACQFDLLGVLFFLSSVLALLAAIERRSAARYVLSLVFYGGALFTKEFALPLLGVYLVLLAGTLGRRSAALTGTLPFALLAALFLFARSRALAAYGGALGGAYGSIFDLYAAADLPWNLWRYAQSLVLLHRKSYSLAVPAAWLYAAIVLGFGAVALWRSTRIALVTIALFAATTLPVLWMHPSYETTGAGRVLYAPALFFCSLVALGVERWRPRRWVRASRALIVIALLAASLATVSQVRLWIFATALARRTVAYVLPRLDGSRAVHITNLPFLMAEGPCVLKTYNFGHHLWAAGKPASLAISADAVEVSYFDTTVQTSMGPEEFGASRRADEIEITLPLDLLRHASRR